MDATRDKVPDWLLERLAAGELLPEKAAELRERLKTHGEEHRLLALATSSAEILKALPPEKVVREIERRTKAGAMRRARPVWALSAVAACAAGLAVMLVLRDRGDETKQPPTATQPETITVKGLKPSLRIYRKTTSGSENLPAQSAVRRGDTLQIRYVAAGKKFGVIASIDARGQITFHLPETPGQAIALERDGERALPHAYELDDSPGFERFVFVTAEAPFDSNDILPLLKNGSPLPARFSWYELALKKETP